MKKEIITSESPDLPSRLREIIEYRDLFFALAYKDFMIKYAQTYLGLVWAILQPLATIIIFTFVFGKIIGTDTQGVPYPLFLSIGMCSWNYFSVVMQQSGASIINSQAMVQKIYFPRLILPFSKAFVGLADYVISLVFMAVLMLYYQYPPNIHLLVYPLVFLWLIITSLGTGVWLSSLSIKYRDFQYILPYMVQFGLYATPVGYSIANIKSSYTFLLYLNPITGIIEVSRWCFIGQGSVSSYCIVSMVVSIVIFSSSIIHFGKTEAKMSDLL